MMKWRQPDDLAGGASGLGLAIVKRFAQAGAHVTVLDLNANNGNRIATALQTTGLSVSFVRCDITNHSSCVEAFKHAIEVSPTKTIDVVALMAGVIGEPGSFVDKITKGQQDGHRQPPKLRRPGLDVNLVGIYNCA